LLWASALCSRKSDSQFLRAASSLTASSIFDKLSAEPGGYGIGKPLVLNGYAQQLSAGFFARLGFRHSAVRISFALVKRGSLPGAPVQYVL
jgi:hypothetical protein